MQMPLPTAEALTILIFIIAVFEFLSVCNCLPSLVGGSHNLRRYVSLQFINFSITPATAKNIYNQIHYI